MKKVLLLRADQCIERKLQIGIDPLSTSLTPVNCCYRYSLTIDGWARLFNVFVPLCQQTICSFFHSQRILEPLNSKLNWTEEKEIQSVRWTERERPLFFIALCSIGTRGLTVIERKSRLFVCRIQQHQFVTKYASFMLSRISMGNLLDPDRFNFKDERALFYRPRHEGQIPFLNQWMKLRNLIFF